MKSNLSLPFFLVLFTLVSSHSFAASLFCNGSSDGGEETIRYRATVTTNNQLNDIIDLSFTESGDPQNEKLGTITADKNYKPRNKKYLDHNRFTLGSNDSESISYTYLILPKDLMKRVGTRFTGYHLFIDEHSGAFTIKLSCSLK